MLLSEVLICLAHDLALGTDALQKCEVVQVRVLDALVLVGLLISYL